MTNIDWDLASNVTIMAIVISMILLFFGIGTLIFIHVCIVERTFRRGVESGGRIAESSSNGSTSMSRDEVEKLPCYDYIAKSKRSSPVECAVCLDNFEKGEKCRLLPICNHSFHAQCVDPWLLKNPHCPICRTTTDSRRFGEESSRFSDVQIELTENEATEIREVNAVRIELGVGDVRTESIQNQTNIAGTPLDSNPSPLSDPRLQNV